MTLIGHVADGAADDSTADGAIGSERNRSMIPFCRSSARPEPVKVAPKTTVCAKMPGDQELPVVAAARHVDRAAEDVARTAART